MLIVFKIRFILNEVCQLSWHGLTNSSGKDKPKRFPKIALERGSWCFSRLKRANMFLLTMKSVDQHGADVEDEEAEGAAERGEEQNKKDGGRRVPKKKS